jgi:hypothetical protein
MPQTLFEILQTDHRRLDSHLKKSRSTLSGVDEESFAIFRRVLLRHIGIEEKVLFPPLRTLKDSRLDAMMKTLHLDHAAIAAILVLSPTAKSVRQLEELLFAHNRREEEEDGLYPSCDRLPAPVVGRMTAEAQNYPEVSVKPCMDTERSRQNAERALKEALSARGR